MIRRSRLREPPLHPRGDSDLTGIPLEINVFLVFTENLDPTGAGPARPNRHRPSLRPVLRNHFALVPR